MRGPPTGWVGRGRAGGAWDPGTRGDSWCLQTSASSQEEGVTVLASRGSCHSATQHMFTENLLLPGTVCSQQRAKPSPGSRGAPQSTARRGRAMGRGARRARGALVRGALSPGAQTAGPRLVGWGQSCLVGVTVWERAENAGAQPASPHARPWPFSSCRWMSSTTTSAWALMPTSPWSFTSLEVGRLLLRRPGEAGEGGIQEGVPERTRSCPSQ